MGFGGSPLRFMSVPGLVVFLVGLPVAWAYPEDVRSWRAAGILLGWAACGFLLSSLVLMVREARLSFWLGGIERMTLWHHWTGMAGYALLLAHPLALAADAWHESPPLGWALLSPFGESWPIWSGWSALLILMAGLAGTFRASLSYSRWRWLHATLGFGVLLGFAHVLSLGIDAGAILAMLAGLLLLLWRLIRVDVGLAAKPFVVRSATRLPGDIVEVRLAPLAQALSAEPGQYVLVAFFRGPRYRGCGEYHPFTVSAIGGKETGGEFRIDVKALGDCTRRMQTLEAGVTARVLGPFGEFLAQRCPGPQLWVAGGIGITPFLGALRSQPPRHSTHLLYLFRSDADAAFIGELERAARENAGFTFLAQATGSGLPDLAKLLPAGDLLASRDCYLCGPPGLVKAAATLLQARGVPAHAIHRERFDFR